MKLARRRDAGRDDAERRAARDDQETGTRTGAPQRVGLRPVVLLMPVTAVMICLTVKGTMEKTITQDIATRVSKYLNKLGIAVERTNPHGGFRALSGEIFIRQSHSRKRRRSPVI
ncbi:MAG: hypothetical protein R3D26_05450 [Cyanobacteriota/Melainabacteria group bacterium]